MDLRLLVISDTHLGEDTSVLNFAEGVAHFGKTLDNFGLRRVEELVLLGDIPDRTLSSTAQIIDKTSAFMTELTHRLDIQRLVYVPGNHDHTLWSSYLQARHGLPSGISSLRGERLIKDGKPETAPGVAPLLEVFFGKPTPAAAGSPQPSPGRIARVADFVIANPVYVVPSGHGLARTYVLMHGSHFRKDVSSDGLRKAFDQAQLDWILAHTEIDSSGKMQDAKDLADLERIVTPFVDALWPSSGDNPVQPSDTLWFVLTTLSGKFTKGRIPPAQSWSYTWDDLPKADNIACLTPAHAPRAASLDRFRKYVWPHLLTDLTQNGYAAGPRTFVYGDTHNGGWGVIDDLDMRVYNTGAWVIHNAKHHPPCHLFAVDDQGRELLMDVSFEGVVHGSGQALLSYAAWDVEHRHSKAEKALGASRLDPVLHLLGAFDPDI